MNVSNVRNLVLLNNQWDNEIMDFGQDRPAEYVLLIIDVGICALDACRFFKAQRNLQEPQALVKGISRAPPWMCLSSRAEAEPRKLWFPPVPQERLQTTPGERGARLS